MGTIVVVVAYHPKPQLVGGDQGINSVVDSLFEAAVMLGGWNTAALVKAFASTPAYFVQITGSAVLYVIVGTALDKMGFKKSSWLKAR